MPVIRIIISIVLISIFVDCNAIAQLSLTKSSATQHIDAVKTCCPRPLISYGYCVKGNCPHGSRCYIKVFSNRDICCGAQQSTTIASPTTTTTGCNGGCKDLMVNTTTITGSVNGITSIAYTSGVSGCRFGSATLTCMSPDGKSEALIYAILDGLGTQPFVVSGANVSAIATVNLQCVNGVYEVDVVGNPSMIPFSSIECASA